MEVWKEHLLTSDEQDAFEQEGYFVVEDALSPDEVDRINAAMDRCEIESRSSFRIRGKRDARISTSSPGVTCPVAFTLRVTTI